MRACFILMSLFAMVCAGQFAGKLAQGAVNSYGAAPNADCGALREELNGKWLNAKGGSLFVNISATSEVTGTRGAYGPPLYGQLVCSGPFQFAAAYIVTGDAGKMEDAWAGLPAANGLPARWVSLTGCEDIYGDEIMDSPYVYTSAV